MSAVLVTGADGFVGSAVAEALRAAGHRVQPVVRALRPESSTDARAVGDISASVAWPSLLKGIEVVVHCAGRAHVLREEAAEPLEAFRTVNRDASVTLARAAAGSGVRRFIFLSSIGVLGGETGARPFRADDPVEPHSAYAVAKAEAEAGLASIAAETGMELVVIRPPLVLGRGAKGNLGALANVMRKGVLLPFGRVTSNRRDLVSLETLADLISICVDHPTAAGQTFLVADGAPLSTRGIVERIATLEGLRPHFLPVPPALLGAGLRLLGRGALASQLLGNLEVDIAPTRERLGWSPPPLSRG
ncbi:MAG TPA: NAD-dependent epimerase/dehydratase family protein [Allosphingosinicella sp.]|uniref:NAD-dependent epimerase/dehydratase family protein n=1 Tax=Allosphingosinicella sp. TaxID=2823234 RepID=UPI002ED83F58